MEAEQVPAVSAARIQVYGVPLGAEAERRIFGLVNELRRAGIAADQSFGGRGLKGAMKGADRSGAAYALILGERDLAAGSVQLKELASGEQIAVPLTDIVTVLVQKLQ
jgi:histidyl-tRNA synthetase